MSHKINPCLWFDDRIEEAANFYAEVFKGKVLGMQRYPDGRVLTAHVDIHGTTFMLLNGGPQHKFTEATSFVVHCKDQAEVDYYWDALRAGGGREDMCAWLKDRFGLSWQIVPEAMPGLIGGEDRAGAGRALQAMMKMRKIVIADLEKAYAGE